jgi:hypothetical protein
MIARAMKAAMPTTTGGYENNQNIIGAAAAAIIELSETILLIRTITANSATNTSVTKGANARKTPKAVATPFPPLNFKKIG